MCGFFVILLTEFILVPESEDHSLFLLGLQISRNEVPS